MHSKGQSSVVYYIDNIIANEEYVGTDPSACRVQEFRCDSRVDCLDGSDEWRCAGAPTTSAPAASSTARADDCAAPALRCDNGSRCVPLPQLCDGERDCADGADEADRCGERGLFQCHRHFTVQKVVEERSLPDCL